MKYRTQSAEVLNEADALERRMEWMLFATQQNAMLWTGKDEWQPGVPLFPHPHNIYDPWMVSDIAVPENYMGNHVRPLFEVFDGHDGWNGYRVRCADCEVYFDSTENTCFVCHKDVEPIATSQHMGDKFSPSLTWQRLYTQPEMVIGSIDRVVEDADGLRAEVTMFDDFDIDFNRYRFVAEARRSGEVVATARHYIDRDAMVSIDAPDVMEWLRREMRDMLNEELSRLLGVPRQHLVSPRRAGRNRAEQYAVYAAAFRDEAVNFEMPVLQGIRGMRWGIGPFSIAQQPTVSSQAEETPVCEEFDTEFSVENLYTDGPTTTPSFVLPLDLDLSGVRAIEPPVVDISSEVVETNYDPGWVETPITERRRTRG